MPLSSSFFLPHSPVLLPTIGREHRELMKETLRSIEKVKTVLETEQPDTLIILSSHTTVPTPTFNLNLSSQYKPSLEEFGDLSKAKVWDPDIAFIHTLRALGYDLHDVNLHSEEKLAYGLAIPLLMAASSLQKVKIVPVTLAKLPLPEVFRFGELINSASHETDKKISIIAAGDLSHRLSKASPSGFSPKARVFDQQVVRAVREKKVMNLTKLSDKLLEHVAQCGIRPLLILGGAFAPMNYRVEVLRYESPFGVGYLTGMLSPY